MIDVVYEDNQIIVVVKPQNVASQADSSGDTDMLTMVKDYVKEKYNKPGNVYVGLVHRLDRPTGGLMVFAKTSKAASRLTDAIKQNEVSKNYLLVAEGIIKTKSGALKDYLKKNEQTNTVSVVGQAVTGAKFAELNYQTLCEKENLSLVKVNLITGRSHQIRAQFKNMGNVLYGDVKYGSKSKGNLALWAYELKLIHPVTKQKMSFKIYPPLSGVWKNFEKEITLQ